MITGEVCEGGWCGGVYMICSRNPVVRFIILDKSQV